jgi:sortase B
MREEAKIREREAQIAAKAKREREKHKYERLEQERLDQERLEQEKLEQERLEQERLEQERLDQERLEQERLEQEKLEILPDLKELYDQNPDLVGWLKIDSTKINFPVLYTQDEKFYLDHNFWKKKDQNGSIFIDYRCNLEPRDENLLVHGHNMNLSHSMFYDLLKYKNKDFYEGHKIINFDTLYKKEIYEVVAMFRTKLEDGFPYYNYITLKDDKKFEGFIKSIKELSIFDTGVEINRSDIFITLSTCDVSIRHGRFIVIAKKI